ncbi:TIR domain-containing protein [Yersinia enterocolitica]|uniref:TIR domain-containing protein n=1 Tax=Yersinia ruckeri TaxID=29486 RepID=UPI0020C15C36|nr:TIR domain-containing protein [Yersinia ruckeri]MCK8566303.1 TIR domain-containing protein [Yersinia ruckeri]MCW6595677.1 TIR domain-containing protein [Yersinia ruckeri]UZY20056.1 TIR domain-containing protein [Yersinia ruckeri]
MGKHKVFISYHHANDQGYKNALETMNDEHQIFINRSVSLGDIDEDEEPQKIREIIRDKYLRDTTVLILLVGTETKNRKHVDWEVFSSMRDSAINKKSGILVVNLPSTKTTYIRSTHGSDEKSEIHSTVSDWVSIDKRSTFEERFPYMPARIIDNFMTSGSYISVVNWNQINGNPDALKKLIDMTYDDREKAIYNMSRDMRMRNG